jgi:hypothetical protein
VLQRRLYAFVAFCCAVTKAHQPLRVVAQVIANFFLSACRDLGNASIGTTHQRFELQQVERLEQDQFRDRVAEMTVGLLDQQTVSVFVLIAQERKIVFATTPAFELSGIGVEHARLTNVVEREIRVRQLFLELRIGSDDFDHALAENQRVVTESQYVRETGVVNLHRFSTPSGIS